MCDAKAQFAANHNANQFVFGYVDTAFATADYTDPASAISTQLLQWQRIYPTQVQGMFLDDGPSFTQSPKSDTDFRNYYIRLYNQLHKAVADGGPGWQVMLNASQYPGQNQTTGAFNDSWILNAPAADSAIVFEQPKPAYDNHYGALIPGGNVVAAPAWWQTSGPDYATAHVIAQATQFDLKSVVDRSNSLGASLIYAFDGTSKGYDHVSCYFEEQASYVQGGALTSGAGKTYCSNIASCTDLRTDSGNCGSCGHGCGSGLLCQSASCVAPPPPAQPPPKPCKNCVTP